MWAWDLEEQLGICFPICSYPTELQEQWLAERKKKRGFMQGVFQPTINPVNMAADIYRQVLGLVIVADNQSERIQGEYTNLLHSLKSGEVSLENLVIGENGFEILPQMPQEDVVKPSKNGKKAKELVTS